MTSAFDLALYVALPYVSVGVAVVATIERYRRHAYSCTSQSTQFLENRLHFWAMVPFHAGILVLLVGHLVAFLVPQGVIAWNSAPVRLYVLEAMALAAGLLALGGFGAVIVRRVVEPSIRLYTRWIDWVVYALLFIQIATGVVIAVRYTWGSSWFAAVASPYLWSLVTLQPETGPLVAMPLVVRAHVAGTWLLLAIFPFSKLVHILMVPNAYLWRAPQVVRWYGLAAAPGGRHDDRFADGHQG
jgi:nitrate reductase gamma subunit